ncbi:MAG TPA: DUF445 domain-containing protein [Acidimicrobiales bacterium]
MTATAPAPAPPARSPAPTPPPTSNEALRRRQLRVARRRATGLFVLVTVVFVVLVLAGGDATWTGYARAAVEASMVGALADWFAVTALFRHPLGVPIPHTAVIPERKDQFGETLGDFVQTSFLTADNIVERVRAAHVVDRLAAWLATPAHAERLARHVADGVVTVADVLGDDEVQRAIEDAVRRRVEATPLAPLAGRALNLLTEGGRHQELLDAGLRGLDRFLQDDHENLRALFASEAPWWLPESVEDRLFDRLMDGARNLLHEVAADPDHPLRRRADARIRELVVELQESEAMRARGEELKAELLDHPELRAWTATVWRDVKAMLRDQAADPRSELRRHLALTAESLGHRLQDDTGLAERVEKTLESGVRYVSEQFDEEIAAMVSGTVARWDGREAADRLELLLGPDLQFIRINGTVVGGAAGLLIYAVAQALG